MSERHSILASTLVLVLALAAPPAQGQPSPARKTVTSEVVDLTTRPGVTTRYVGLTMRGARRKPIGVSAILLAGGDGVVSISGTGSIGKRLALNFLIRSREGFLDLGLDHVAVVDAPSPYKASGLDGTVRLSAGYATDIGAVIADVRQRWGRPVWVISTSASTIAAAAIAGRFTKGPSTPAGIVLTSAQTRRVPGLCGKVVMDAPITAVVAPVLIVAHKGDLCDCHPSALASKLAASFTAARRREALPAFTGGLPARSTACNALSPHGFYGIEREVVTAIVDWIAAAGPKPFPTSRP